MNRKYYSVDETAEKLGVHPKTIRRYINSGKISASKVAGSWRVYEESLGDYMNTCESGSCQSGSVSSDDFCIFMDNDYFTSEDTLQLCTIVDYFVQGEEMTQLVKDVAGVVAEHNLMNQTCKYSYTYDDADKKVRLVFWGTPSFMEKVVVALKPYEK